ncbi:MAG TPA: choice-of-anchor L domain-containing protein [Saprospiraceae bacterium]|nr:choice-of-anchor L domain-containing protein [Saprospiraceae bacterium]
MANNRLLFLIIATLLPGGAFYSSDKTGLNPQTNSGIRTFQDSDTERLVQEVFLKDGCANVSNIQRIGDERGVGYFDTGAGNIGFAEGIVLATGLVSNAEGPNSSNERTTGFGEDSLDPDLRSLSTGEIFDNVGIEFDFVPQKEFVSFNYVFASEEYCEFVGSIFNDVFGFFVSGPGISGPFGRNAVNVALIPETEEFVAINNVNHQRNSDYYVKNELRADAARCGIPFQPAFETEIEYDGFTVRLKAVFRVIPCETYHIRLVVGDVGDDQLDSAVFLESKSFDIGPEVEVKYIPENSRASATILTEGCNNGFLLFSRTDLEKLDQDLPIHYSYSENTNAREGEDFTALPDSLVIPANEISLRIPFQAIEDNIPEEAESLGIEILSLCNCNQTDSTLLSIQDPGPIQVASNTVELCPEEPAEIQVEVVAGTAPFSYRWQNGSQDPIITLDSIVEGDDYRVTITDFCGDTLETSVNTRLLPAPRLALSGTYDWCQGTQVDIPLQLEGTAPWQLEYQIAGDSFLVDNITREQFVLSVNRAGTLSALSLSDAFCSGPTVGQVIINDNGPRADPILTPLRCPDENSASIDLNISSQFPYQVRWDQSVNDQEAPSELVAGTYSFTITDQNNCTFSNSIQIAAPDLQTAIANGCPSATAADNLYIPTAFSPNNDGKNDGFRLFPQPAFQAKIRSWRIFDRWGNQLFEALNFTPGDSDIFWDGSHKNRKLPSGVYVYQLEIETATGEVQILSGSVTLMR